jgi:hypothetical protein
MSVPKIDIHDPSALRRAGIEALTKALGPVGMARFLRLYDRGVGDYTAERDQWLGEWDVDRIFQEAERRRGEGTG